MTTLTILLTVLLAAGPASAGSGHHVHESGELPAAAELCSCGSATIRKSTCVLGNAAGTCLLFGERGGSCTQWHCHPGQEEAHKAPWKPGKKVALKPLPQTAPAAPAGAASCKPEPTEASFPRELEGPGVSDLAGCLDWVGTSRVDYPSVDGKADCAHPAPTLVTRCTATLDPAYRLTRTYDKSADCSCAEWTAVAQAMDKDGSGTTQTSSCSAYICRPKRKG